MAIDGYRILKLLQKLLKKETTWENILPSTAQKMKFSMKDLFSKCGNCKFRKLRIWSHLLKKSLMEKLHFWHNVWLEQKKKFPSENERFISKKPLKMCTSKVILEFYGRFRASSWTFSNRTSIDNDTKLRAIILSFSERDTGANFLHENSSNSK